MRNFCAGKFLKKLPVKKKNKLQNILGVEKNQFSLSLFFEQYFVEKKI
jgi:hypothetical protein